MEDIVLVTGRQMRTPDPESHLLVAALRQRGIGADVQPWGDGFEWAAARLVVVRTTWDYFDHRDKFIAWAARVAESAALVNPIEVLEWNSHKGYLLDLQRAGVPTIVTTVVPQGVSAAAQDDVLLAHTGEVVIKPAVSGGALGALRVAPGTTAAQAHLASLLENGDALVQPFAEAVLRKGEVSLIYFAGAFSHAVRKLPAAGDYRVQAQYGGLVVPHEPTAAEREVGAAALAVTPRPTSYGRIDLVDVLGQPAVMELEVIEPELFLGQDAAAPDRFADHLGTLLT
jgi:glutathione synthase/RimK-type ligase-like ATP-grasp enzyme